VVLDPKDDSRKFIIDGKKDDVVGVVTTYISREIHFHTSGIDCQNNFWKKLNTMFDKANESYAD
jgi:hypothetical protein